MAAHEVVQYAYSEMSGGANHSRLTMVTYPNSRAVKTLYVGTDDKVSRPTRLHEGDPNACCGSPIEQSAYLGWGTVVERRRRARPRGT